MSHRPIMDAGPGINFFSINKERLLFDTLGALSVPEIVRDEMMRKARTDRRFAATERVLGKLPEKYLKVLSDDVTSALAKVVTRISRMPIGQRLASPRDLGETMVIAHASVAAEADARVTVLIDDGLGCRLAAQEARRLQRMGAAGSIELVHTVTVLERAAGGKHIPNRGEMRKLYDRLRRLDDGLPSSSMTSLLSLPCWRNAARRDR